MYRANRSTGQAEEGCPQGLCCLHPWRFLGPNWIKPWANWPNTKWIFSLQTLDHQPCFHLHGTNQCRFARSIIFGCLFPPSLAVPPDICWFGLWADLSRKWSPVPPEDYPPVWSTLAKPHLDPVSGFGPQCKKGINKVEWVQPMAPRVAGVGAMLHEERLRKMGLFSLEKRRFREHPTAEEQPSSTLIQKMEPSSSQHGMQEDERKQA